jgi:hypothetical protein
MSQTFQSQPERESCDRRILVSETMGVVLYSCTEEEVQDKRLLVAV